MKKKNYTAEYILMALTFIVGFTLSYRTTTATERTTTLFALTSIGAFISDIAFLYLLWRWICRNILPKAKKTASRLLGKISALVRRISDAFSQSHDNYGRVIIRGTDTRTFIFDTGKKERQHKRKMPREKDYRTNAEKIRYAYISYIFSHDKYVSNTLTPHEAIETVGDCEPLSEAYYPARYSENPQIDDATVAEIAETVKRGKR